MCQSLDLFKVYRKLSESMKYLTMGKWWLALFPGILLVLVVMLFHVIGDTLNSLLDPSRAHE